MAKDLKVGLSGARRSASFIGALNANPNTKIVAVCDVREEAARGTAAKCGEGVQTYADCETMLDKAGLDILIVASPMQFHVPQSAAALARNVHVLSEVTAAVCMDECRWLVGAAKRSKAKYMMAENTTYMKNNVLLRAMVEAGVFGDVYFAEGEYLHELSALHHTADGKPTWRYYWQVGVNGCTYGSHSLGPCLQWTKERVERVSCIGTGRWTDPEHAMEDTVLMLCKTRAGKLIKIRVDMLSKRPHAMLNFALQGTKGAYESARAPGERHRIWLKDFCANANDWRELKEFEEQFLPECWKHPPEAALKAGHAGSDYFEVADFVEAILNDRQPPIGVHEAMDMTLPGILSQESISREGEWVKVPDTRTW